ncbi:MAG: TolC family protein [Gammaproteobacteria bacterium]|nr:TolC family protein [Gammaproteobacteria bacterium]
MSCQAWASEVALPEPLTLEFALGLASEDHPQVRMAAADLERSRARQWQVGTETGIDVRLSARLRWVDPPSIGNIEQSHRDHLVKLSLNKSLYDFGRSTAKENATLAERNQRAWVYQDLLTRRRIDIMAAFFDVLLADQIYARDTEEMSIAFSRFDRARGRNELGQLSDIDFMKASSEYQAGLLLQAQRAATQRIARARLADILNRPGQLSGELSVPLLNFERRKIPGEVADWFAELDQESPQLQALKAQLASAKAKLDLARVDDNPLLLGQLEVSEYTRIFGNDNWRAGVSLDVPLFDSSRNAALQAVRRAELRKIEADMEEQRRVLRQELLETWSELQTLQIEKRYLATNKEYRELYLDLGRVRYELEVASDLDDAMVGIPALQYDVMRMSFAMALAWARIDALLGRQYINNE